MEREDGEEGNKWTNKKIQHTNECSLATQRNKMWELPLVHRIGINIEIRGILRKVQFLSSDSFPHLLWKAEVSVLWKVTLTWAKGMDEAPTAQQENAASDRMAVPNLHCDCVQNAAKNQHNPHKDNISKWCCSQGLFLHTAQTILHWFLSGDK